MGEFGNGSNTGFLSVCGDQLYARHIDCKVSIYTKIFDCYQSIVLPASFRWEYLRDCVGMKSFWPPLLLPPPILHILQEPIHKRFDFTQACKSLDLLSGLLLKSTQVSRSRSHIYDATALRRGFEERGECLGGHPGAPVVDVNGQFGRAEFYRSLKHSCAVHLRDVKGAEIGVKISHSQWESSTSFRHF